MGNIKIDKLFKVISDYDSTIDNDPISLEKGDEVMIKKRAEDVSRWKNGKRMKYVNTVGDSSYELLEILAVKHLFRNLEDIEYETQNTYYEGFKCSIDNKIFRSRRANITPKKLGYFVAFWEKDSNKVNSAYKSSENINKLIITIIDFEKRGQFVFPKNVLTEKGILKSAQCKGKMSMRVYPTWSVNLNATARKAQKWQTEYFIDFTNDIEENILTQLYFK